MEEIKFVSFSNGISVVNTTPHPISIQSPEGELVSVPTSVLINASSTEEAVDDLLVKTIFLPTEEGKAIIAEIESQYTGTGRLVIIGSMIAAQAYPGKVVGMVAVPGYERVAPAEKRMRCDKFTTF